MSTSASRSYNWVTDKNAGTAITASRMDTEFDGIITKLNQKVIIAASAPSGPIAGMLWLDSTNKLLKQYRNSEWVVNGVVHVGTAAPTTCQEGDLWYDSTNNILKIYTSTTAAIIAVTSGSFGTLGQMICSSGGSGTAPTSMGMGTINQFLTSQGIGSAPLFKTWSDVIGTAYVKTTDLKTTTGEVSSSTGNSHQVLPGGEYGFYPQSKWSAAGNHVLQMYDYSKGAGMSTDYQTLIAFEVGASTLYVRQRYVTSSGVDHWLFLLVDKSTRGVIRSYSAPDHPAVIGGDFHPDFF